MELTLNILETNKSFKNKIFLAICEELTLKFLIMKIIFSIIGRYDNKFGLISRH